MAQETSSDESDENDAAVMRSFHDAVNMAPARIEDWLTTPESKAVGYKTSEGGESVGHHSGQRIVAILRKKKADLDADDIAHMRKVVGYVHRHLAQRPKGDVSATNWRYSLMNWGHYPLHR